ncbi:lysine exporter LysO family protein [Zophobihabitans entericus]|uniref:Lysine exporter LysO family protein n=1 Tax=Zophobihabitans entericus TaxID=1635327 RepID=A0A6G9IDV6_9GAMM|nr:lysine exporter LysO family protein [Zophobihabitans entericus]QIQ21884.1 lysine exporter LysO family protein [Zophobihabitans entericus]
MYSGLLIVLLPIFIGYLIKLKQRKLLDFINKLLGLFVYIILFFMGISLAQLDDLGGNLQSIMIYSGVFFACTFGCNFIALMVFDVIRPWKESNNAEALPSTLKMILESLQICISLVAGFLVGLLPLPFFEYASKVIEVALIILLFIVGIQLRSSGMTIKQILLNKIGLMTTVIVAITALIGGTIAAVILDLPVKTGLAVSSGFGWYSLSGILLTEAHGPILGSTAFFNDLLRELFAVLLIPSLIRRYRMTTLGLCGATSMDFTLPILQKGGGVSMVPPAIVQGFLLSLLVPILMTLFLHI